MSMILEPLTNNIDEFITKHILINIWRQYNETIYFPITLLQMGCTQQIKVRIPIYDTGAGNY